MNKTPFTLILCACWTALSTILSAAGYISSPPLSEVVRTTPKAWSSNQGTLRVPLIAWGGDLQTILANGGERKTTADSLFAQNGLQIELFREDIFSKQVEAYLRGETPFLRGTMGMINLASEITQKNPDTEMVVIYQLTWSAGGDALVVKDSIQSPRDLKGKTIAVQAYGPHVDYLTTVLQSVGLSASDVTIKWVPDLFVLDQNSLSPALALQQDKGVDAAMVIIPDGLALTSGGTVGTGAEGSVKGAKILLSTKTANRVIADVYAVRKDFYKKNPEVVEKFISCLLQAEEQLRDLVKAQSPALKKLISSSAQILLDDAGAVEDMTAMYYDAEFAGWQGNVKFFNDPSNPRRMSALNSGIQQEFITLGLLSQTATIQGAPIDYNNFTKGLKYTSLQSAPRFDSQQVAAVVNKRVQLDNLSDGELYSFEIYFQPNQQDFSADLYKGEFDKVVDLVSTYGGALLTIEGHSDPTGYLRSKKENAPEMVKNRVKQAAKNLSYARANSLKDSLIQYAQSQGITLDASQFGVVGHGVMKPNTANVSYDSDGDLSLASAPRTKAEWEATRRVVFRLIQVEAEAEVFEPLF